MAVVGPQRSSLGRDHERAVLRDLVAGARVGRSGAVVVHGEPGIGKTTLLDSVAADADGFAVLRVGGVPSEADIGFAALHRLLSPLRSAWAALPPPQRRALEITFGLGDGATPDRFLVGLAALTLLDDAARARPVLCLVDDAHWIDQESMCAMAFVARRLGAESLAVVFAFRDEPDSSTELPEGIPRLPVGPLAPEDAAALLRSVVPSPLDALVSERILGDAEGSPLAIVELAAALTPGQLLSADLLPRSLPIGERLERHFLDRLRTLPAEARALLVLAALDVTGDPATVVRAAASVGVSSAVESVESVETSGLLRLVPAVTFRHPLVRSAVLADASPSTQRRAHAALADAVEGADAEEARVWHLAGATFGPDEDVAAALDRHADVARLRGSPAAEAALRARAAELTRDPELRSDRQVRAAHAHLLAGSPARAAELVDAVAPGGPDAVLAEVGRIRALLASFSTPGPVPAMLLDAADRARPSDPKLALRIDAQAVQATLVSCQLTWGVTPDAVAQRVLDTNCDRQHAGGVVDLLRLGFATRLAGDYGASAVLLDRALDLCADPDDELLHELEHWTVFVNNLPAELWDLDRTTALLDRMEHFARQRGALESLRITLGAQAHQLMWRGRFAAAEAAHGEATAIAVALGGDPARWKVLEVELAAWTGDEATTRAMAGAMMDDAVEEVGSGVAVNLGRAAVTVLALGQGHYEEALEMARRAAADDVPPQGNQCLPDLVEAATRCGERELALEALTRLEERVAVSSSPWSRGLLARSRAMVAADGDAEAHHRQGLDELARSGLATEQARSHLVYGEWLRRRNRRIEAREQLRSAHAMFGDMGAHAFQERARAEMAATGERARRRAPGTESVLTPQEHQIAGRAAAGQTNREIAAALFISPSTVDYHLRKVFRKLGVTSRRRLAEALPTR